MMSFGEELGARLLAEGRGQPTAMAEVNVSKRLVTATAPDIVVFEIVNLAGFDTQGPDLGEVYDPRFHELYYFWDFGDTTYSNFSAPTRLRREHNRPNVMYGPWGRHVYRNPGSYSPKCIIHEPSSGKWAIAYLNSESTDSGTAGMATAAIDVADPDVTFSRENTVFMSPSGSFRNAPSGCVQVTGGDIDAVLSDVANRIVGQEAIPKRVILNRGESYTFSGYQLGSATDIPTLHVVAGGDVGAKPSVTQTGQWGYEDRQTVLGDNAKDFVFDGIEWNGPYDPVSNTGDSSVQFYGTRYATAIGPATVLCHDCTFNGFGTLALDLGDTANPHHLAVVDCSITKWKAAGIYDYGADFTTFLGTSIKSPPLALTDAADGMGAPYRGGKCQHVVFACDIFSKQGWGGLAYDKWEEQTCLRMNAEGERGAQTYVGCTIFEGARVMLRYTQSGVLYSQECNHICEKNFFLASAQTDTFVQVNQAGVTIRNNVMSWGAINRSEHNGAFTVVDLLYTGVYPQNQNTPIKVYSNTASYLSDGAPFDVVNFTRNRDTEGAGTFNDVTSENNIVHQPNASPSTDLTLADDRNDFLPIRIAYVDSNEGPDYDEGTAHSAIDFDAKTAAFTLGAILTGSTSGATAYVYYIIDGSTTGTLFVGEVSNGPFQDGETITDSSGGSARVNGLQRDSGFTDDFIPLTGSSVIGAYIGGLVAYDDFYGNVRDTVLNSLTRSTYSVGAHEPNLES